MKFANPSLPPSSPHCGIHTLWMPQSTDCKTQTIGSLATLNEMGPFPLFLEFPVEKLLQKSLLSSDRLLENTIFTQRSPVGNESICLAQSRGICQRSGR